jgi:hypothetical protein
MPLSSSGNVIILLQTANNFILFWKYLPPFLIHFFTKKYFLSSHFFHYDENDCFEFLIDVVWLNIFMPQLNSDWTAESLSANSEISSWTKTLQWTPNLSLLQILSLFVATEAFSVWNKTKAGIRPVRPFLRCYARSPTTDLRNVKLLNVNLLKILFADL